MPSWNDDESDEDDDDNNDDADDKKTKKEDDAVAKNDEAEGKSASKPTPAQLRAILRVTDREWTVLSVSVDNMRGRVTAYINGHLLGEADMPASELLRPTGPYVIKAPPPEKSEDGSEDSSKKEGNFFFCF